MRTKEIETQVKRWHDKINGNSYFSARVTVWNTRGRKSTFCIPFQYGYGSHPFFSSLMEAKAKKLVPSSDWHELHNLKKWTVTDADIGYGLKRDCVAFGKDGL